MSSPLLFDRALLRRRRDRAALHAEHHDSLVRDSAAQLIERLGDIKRDFRTVLNLGASPDGLGDALAADQQRLIVSADMSLPMLRHAAPPRIAVDEEYLPFAATSFDLVLSNDLPGALMQIRNILKPDGLFMATLPGGATLVELRECLLEAEITVTGGASPRLSPVIDKGTAGSLLQRAGFALPVIDSETVTLLYSDIYALMRDLRGMGEANTHLQRLKHPTRRAIFMRAAELYRTRYGDGKTIPASFEIIHLHGWKSP
jgi:SAM-dependent methyltransferase